MSDATAEEELAGSSSSTALAGIACALSSFVLWGLFPIYFKAVAAIPPLEVLAHRIVWSVAVLAGVVITSRRWRAVLAVVRNRRLLGLLALSAASISLNWGTFVWAVANGRILECSLGYFVSPLVSVLLAVLVLGERLVVWQWLGVALAAVGLGYEIVRFGTVPLVTLVLAGSFAGYGLLRKVAPVDPISGLFVEVLLVFLPALAVLVAAAVRQTAAPGVTGWHSDALLVLAGPLTVLPLLLFVAGARRVRLATLGLLQYVTPTCQFLLAVLLYGEPLSYDTLVTFACIWAGLAVYGLHAVGRPRSD